jgi:HAD superfamily hydrolase (TIGR01509 family)
MLSSPPICCVVFDLDGLLIDSEPIFEEAARRLLAVRGKKLITEVMRQMMGAPAREALPLFRDHHGLNDSIETIGAEYRGHFFAVVGEKPVALMPGALELLERLEAKNVPRAIATSSTARYVEWVLGPHRLMHRFGFVLTADDVTHGKPHPEIYEKAAARFGCPASGMLVLEDSINGMRSAKAAGARCVVVPHALVNVDELSAADAIVPRLDAPELLDLLQL